MKENHELVLVIDFGAQYAQLIARRVRECSVYCEIVPYNCPLEKIKEMNPAAIILSGGPASVYVENAPLTQVFLNWGSRYWVFAMAISLCARHWAGRSLQLIPGSLGRQLLNWTLIHPCSAI